MEHLPNDNRGATRPHDRALPTQVAIALVSVASFLGVLYATASGAGASPDSVTYVQIARNFVQGHGLSQLGPNSTHLPATQYPPAFPLLLGFVGKAGIDPVDAARWINVLLSACTTLLIAAWVHRATGQRLWPALIAALIFVGSSANLTGDLPPLFVPSAMLVQRS